MQFMLTVHGAVTRDDAFGPYASEEEMNEAFAATGRFNEKLEAAGVLVFAGGLDLADTALVVDGRGDKAAITEGPYLPGPERVGGFWVIEVASRDEAVALAAEGSAACGNPIEVRPFAGA